jgi:hypothetical protein
MRKLFALVVMLAMAAGCGGGGGGSTAPTVQPFSQTVTGTVASFDFNFHPLSIPRSGNMVVTLTWSDPVDLDLYLTSTACTGYPPTACSIIVRSDNASGVFTETIQRAVVNGETYKIWVDNFSLTRTGNYTLTIRIN